MDLAHYRAHLSAGQSTTPPHGGLDQEAHARYKAMIQERGEALADHCAAFAREMQRQLNGPVDAVRRTVAASLADVARQAAGRIREALPPDAPLTNPSVSVRSLCATVPRNITYAPQIWFSSAITWRCDVCGQDVDATAGTLSTGSGGSGAVLPDSGLRSRPERTPWVVRHDGCGQVDDHVIPLGEVATVDGLLGLTARLWEQDWFQGSGWDELVRRALRDRA